MNKDPQDVIIGRRVRVKKCEGKEHDNNPGCVCNLIGKVVTIKSKYQSPFVGLPSYWIKGIEKRVRFSEVSLLRKRLQKIRKSKKNIWQKADNYRIIFVRNGRKNVAILGKLTRLEAYKKYLDWSQKNPHGNGKGEVEYSEVVHTVLF